MNETKPEFSRGDVNLENEGAYFLYQAAGWARFLSITGFVVYGLLILMFLIGLVVIGGNAAAQAFGAQNPMMMLYFSWPFFITMAVVMVIMCIPLVYLYNFSVRTRRAFGEGNSQVLTQSFRALKNLFVFYGVVMIIYLSFLLLSLVFGIIGGIFMAAA